MIQKILKRCLFGASAGLTVWMMTILAAAWLRGGQLVWTSGHGVMVYGSELASVTAQCFSAMVIGTVWAAAALIWQETEWSLLKQTVVNYLLSTVPSMAVAWIMQWMPHSLDGIFQYFRLFAVLYVVNWIVRYLSMKKGVHQINAGLDRLMTEADNRKTF